MAPNATYMFYFCCGILGENWVGAKVGPTDLVFESLKMNNFQIKTQGINFCIKLYVLKILKNKRLYSLPEVL